MTALWLKTSIIETTYIYHTLNERNTKRGGEREKKKRDRHSYRHQRSVVNSSRNIRTLIRKKNATGVAWS